MVQKKQCSHTYNDNNCPHPLYKDTNFCVFHSEDTAKDDDFKKALVNYLKSVEQNKKIKFYNFIGFKFPEIIFIQTNFNKKAYFSESTFYGNADFRGSTFSGNTDFSACIFSKNIDFSASTFYGNAYFSESTFYGNADFRGSTFSRDTYFSASIFSGDIYFSASTFSGDAYFSASTFSKNTYFSASKFLGGTYFHASTFSGNAYFHASNFFGNAYFQASIFFGGSYFSKSIFKKRIYFDNAIFEDEINLSGAQLDFLKNLELKQISFDNTVLEETHFYEQETVENCSFKNAFLLSLNLAEKEICNCDFTGAVFKAVNTKGWKPNQATIKNTKYIYTDYKVDIEIIEDEQKREFTAKEESRVPADGFFGEDGNEEFTIESYLRAPYKWNYAVAFPNRLQTSFINYIYYFTDVVKVAKKIDIDIELRREGSKIRITFTIEDFSWRENIEDFFRDHMQKVLHPFHEVELIFDKDPVTIYEHNNFIAQYQNQLLFIWTILGNEYSMFNQQQRNQTKKQLVNLSFSESQRQDGLPIVAAALKKTTQQTIKVMTNRTAGRRISDINTLQIGSKESNGDNTTRTNSPETVSIEQIQNISHAIDDLLESIEGVDKPPRAVNNLIEDIEDARKELNNPQKQQQGVSRLKGATRRVKKIMAKKTGKATAYLLKNKDKIISALERLENLRM